MENAEEVMQVLERFTRLKQKEIPKELDDYLQYVAKTGDTVFKWANLKYLFREKLLNVITHFHDTTPRMDEIPQYPNVDPFNYESMKSALLERLELFNAAPFTIQRLCELLIDPKKQYNRIDKFMRALEKNILVSTVEPGRKRTESENGDSLDSVVNGDISLDVNVDIDMENESLFSMEATQNGNGPAVAASPVGTNDSESVSGSKQEDESEVVVNVTSAHEPPTGDDEDLQPSPKKVKLDVGSEAAEVSAKPAEKEEKPEKVEETKIENVENVDIKNSVEKEKVKEIESEEKDIVVEAKAVEKTETEISTKTKDEKETVDNEAKKVGEAEAAGVTPENISIKETEEEHIVEGNTDADAPSKTATEVAVAAEIEAPKETTQVDSSVSKKGSKLEEISSAVEKSEDQEAVEKIIEKQEIEKCEKELVQAKVESSAEDLTSTKTETDKIEIENKETEAETAKAATENSEESNKKPPVADTDIETPTDTTKTEDATSDSASTQVENKGDAEKLITSSSTATAEINAAIIGEAKTEDIKTCVTTTDDIKTVDETSEKVEIASSITSTSGNETKISKEIEIETPSEVTKPEESPAVKTDAIEVTTADPAIVAIVPPTLALNDQPMDEDAITNAVDEVVMAETTTTTLTAVSDGNEMATDAMEATVISDAPKIDEPTDGMDVDDTSPQEEAMDQ